MGAYKDEKRGTWKAKFSYKDYTGKTRWATKRGFKTKREALEYEREFLLQKAGDVDMTFDTFVELYKKDLYPRLKPSTIQTKDNVIDKHVTPYFGHKKLREITKRDVIAWQGELISATNQRTGQPFSKSFLKEVHNQLSAILNYAVKNYDLSDNVASKVGNMGSEDDIKIDFWTEEEYRRFIEEIMDKPFYYYCFETLYWTGMRVGELLALTANDIDFENNTISITKTYHRIKGKDIISSPKTKKSYRTISIPEFLAEELKEYIDMIYKPDPTERLFHTYKAALAKVHKAGAVSAGVKPIRLHDLRHSHISLLIYMGYGAVEIADRVGHESVEITYRYSHMFPNVQKNMSEALDKLNRKEE